MISDTDIHIDTDRGRGSGTDIPIDIGRGTGAANAALLGSLSSYYTSSDVQPIMMIEELPDNVFSKSGISRDSVTEVILHFCRKHRDMRNKPCPTINHDFAKALPNKIANLIDQNTGEYLIDSEKWNRDPDRYSQWYKDMIDMYFDTEFTEGCNYSLQHFFSGNIRVLRYHEVGRLPYEF